VVIETEAAAEVRDSREAILAAVARVIARRGVRGLRVEDVATEAEVSAPLLYYHFGNRAGLVKAALEHAGERAPSG
jgi:AcrR family transcriptional regulator